MVTQILNLAFVLVKSFFALFFPRINGNKRLIDRLLSNNEYELAVLKGFCNPKKDFIDVGGLKGIYAFQLAPFCSTVHFFEPQKICIREAKSVSRKFIKNIRFYNCALDSNSNFRTFGVNLVSNGLSKIESIDPKQRFHLQTMIWRKVIETRSLDSFFLNNVGIVKIDVEGHELMVLEGAFETIAKNRPVVLVESERRHNSDSPEKVFQFFENLNYSGFFFVEGNQFSIKEFQLDKHQNILNAPTKMNSWSREMMYVNNFLFVPNS